mmetsp:Transcript_32024/g.69995  ORF Transcript_32024/g.69995 Transcript_32024/m.69995 type:complete len:593 (+) Transcript_32024:162-1940(+)
MPSFDMTTLDVNSNHSVSCESVHSYSESYTASDASAIDVDWVTEISFDAFLEGAFALGTLAAVLLFRRVLHWKWPRTTQPKSVAEKHDFSNAIPAKAKRLVPEGRDHCESRTTKSTPGRRKGTEADFLAGAVCIGRVNELPQLLDAARRRASVEFSGTELETRLAEQLLSALRACASRKFFREALVAYDHFSRHVGEGNSGIWSLLLYCAVEVGDFQRCVGFTSKLCEHGIPSGLDFVNLVRCYAHLRDVEGLVEILGRLEKMGLRIDSITRNRALAACAKNRAWALVEPLTNNKICAEEMDAVSYNTLMKGHVQAGSPERCFQIYEEMKRSGSEPSEMTFGILLDACIDAKDSEKAKRIFTELRQSGLQPNVVHYTTLMKGLVSASQLDEATDLLEEMLKVPSTKPDLVTYTTLVKAHADCGNITGAFRVLDRMSEQGVSPDSVILNVALSGCIAKSMEAAHVFHVFRWLSRRYGLQLSTATLSIIIKALSQTSAWDEALELLTTAPERMGVWPEKRIFLQLAQSCARAKCGPMVLAVYSATAKAARLGQLTLDEDTKLRLFRLCSSCGQKHGAAAIQQQLAAFEAGGPQQ